MNLAPGQPDPIIRVGLYFTLDEMLESTAAAKHNHVIDVTPGMLQGIIMLVREVLDPLRSAMGAIEVTSGIRDEELNCLVGGALSSDHVATSARAAVDFRSACGVPHGELAAYVRAHLPFDQLIIYDSEKRLHVGYRRENRRGQVLNK